MPPLRPTQCRNCQRLGHAAVSCRYPVQCTRCSGNHSLANCTFKDKADVRCVNCNGAHQASDRKCPAYLQARYAKLCRDAARPDTALLPQQRKQAIFNALSHSAHVIHKEIPTYANILSKKPARITTTSSVSKSISAYSQLLMQEIKLLILKRTKAKQPTDKLQARLKTLQQWK